ncbi:hypothetical protein Ait01nite_059010 [Actinoplanes italicus]|nr:hypothetical protein Ait01nite_059010 [Actinoplanes italicus]
MLRVVDAIAAVPVERQLVDPGYGLSGEVGAVHTYRRAGGTLRHTVWWVTVAKGPLRCNYDRRDRGP